MLAIFGNLIGRTVEAYVGDIVVKSKRSENMVDDLDEAFKRLRAKNVKLNPEKYVFRVLRGMLLGFIVSERCIEANPEKISAITNMGPIQNLKGVQRVTGCLAVLSRFISRLDERGLRSARQAQSTSNQGLDIPSAKEEPLLLYIAATM
jgi:hypothetical protein